MLLRSQCLHPQSAVVVHLDDYQHLMVTIHALPSGHDEPSFPSLPNESFLRLVFPIMKQRLRSRKERVPGHRDVQIFWRRVHRVRPRVEWQMVVMMSGAEGWFCRVDRMKIAEVDVAWA